MGKFGAMGGISALVAGQRMPFSGLGGIMAWAGLGRGKQRWMYRGGDRQREQSERLIRTKVDLVAGDWEFSNSKAVYASR